MKKRSGRIEIIPYRSDLVEKARELRNSATPGEKRLWKYISRRQIHGFDFDRQTPIDNYIVDFCCKELKLVIELDGRYHDFKAEYDERRQKRIESYGVQVIRFEEKFVLEDIDQVLAEIRYWVLEREKIVFDNRS
ncbi:endonuclease domain-containing protein [soil metagenome]